MREAPSDDNKALDVELVKIASLSIGGLRTEWGKLFRSDPPTAFGPDLLRRSLAQKLQEHAYGGLPLATRKLLDQLIAQSTKSAGKIVMPRRIKPGAILVREWKRATEP